MMFPDRGCGRVVPMPVMDVIRVENPAARGHGFVLIAVPRSPLAPHAVVVNDALRYPRRNGATTRYLSEPEVAAAYRERFAAVHRQTDRAQEVESGALGRLSTADNQVWEVTSLVPDLAGELVMDQAALSAARAELMGGGGCPTFSTKAELISHHQLWPNGLET